MDAVWGAAAALSSCSTVGALSAASAAAAVGAAAAGATTVSSCSTVGAVAAEGVPDPAQSSEWVDGASLEDTPRHMLVGKTVLVQLPEALLKLDQQFESASSPSRTMRVFAASKGIVTHFHKKHRSLSGSVHTIDFTMGGEVETPLGKQELLLQTEPQEICGAIFGDPRGGELLPRACLVCPSALSHCCRRARFAGYVDTGTFMLSSQQRTAPPAPGQRPSGSCASPPEPGAPRAPKKETTAPALARRKTTTLCMSTGVLEY